MKRLPRARPSALRVIRAGNAAPAAAAPRAPTQLRRAVTAPRPSQPHATTRRATGATTTHHSASLTAADVLAIVQDGLAGPLRPTVEAIAAAVWLREMAQQQLDGQPAGAFQRLGGL